MCEGCGDLLVCTLCAAFIFPATMCSAAEGGKQHMREAESGWSGHAVMCERTPQNPPKNCLLHANVVWLRAIQLRGTHVLLTQVPLYHWMNFHAC